MKVIVEEKDNSIEYPCLMESTVSGNIVLFLKDQEGVVIYGVDMSSPIGKHRDDWSMECFKPFKDRVVLEN